MAGAQVYSKKVINRSGYILELPDVPDIDSLKIGDLSVYGPYVESSIARFATGAILRKGRDAWHYCKAGATGLSIAAPIQSAARVHAEQDDDIVVGAAAAIGAYTVELTSTANLDNDPNDDTNDFAGGYLIVNDEAGEGQMYRIKSNEGFSGTDDATFTLYDALTIALTTSSQVGLVRAPGHKVVVAGAPLTGAFMGIPLIAVTATYYFWSKIKGYAPMVAQEAIALGDMVVVGGTSGKANVYDAATTTEVVVGVAVTPGVADTESFIVDLI